MNIPEIKKIKISDLVLDKNNLRQHTDSEINLIMKSLKAFGQYKPLIVDKNDMTVKIGNGRLMAMKKLGWQNCDCILYDWNEKSGAEVIDNRLNELSSWIDSNVNSWFKEKGKDWWGVDQLIEKKVEKLLKKEEKKQQKQQKEKEEKVFKCPCCGQTLLKKDQLILD